MTSRAAMVSLLVAVGCGPSRPMREYTIHVSSPDGRIARQYTIESSGEAWVITHERDGGCLRVRYEIPGFPMIAETRPFPVGWFVDVTPQAEATDARP